MTRRAAEWWIRPSPPLAVATGKFVIPGAATTLIDRRLQRHSGDGAPSRGRQDLTERLGLVSPHDARQVRDEKGDGDPQEVPPDISTEVRA